MVYHELDDCALVVVEVTVVGSREYRDHSRKLLLPSPVVHLEPIRLRLVGPDDGQQFVLGEESLGQLIPKKVGAATDLVFLDDRFESPVGIVDWVSPHEIAEESASGDLFKPVKLFYIFQLHRNGCTFFISCDIPP